MLAASLSGCVKSCYTSQDTVLTQTAVGDPADPEVSIAKFPFDSKLVPSLCQTSSPVRAELYIDVTGTVQAVTFLDPWPNTCTKDYIRDMKMAKLVETPLSRPLEHFAINVHTSRVTSRQCIRLQQ